MGGENFNFEILKILNLFILKVKVNFFNDVADPSVYCTTKEKADVLYKQSSTTKRGIWSVLLSWSKH